ncbi:Zinc carboxypeptidase [Roseimaritima multifibrata]|uniref:Zinc carboxypeptidase n=1 Tax=Roseimaritima multifibrata TaxID=1930274 RepID=A0A517MC30_9BACT|nr:M14 family zinc carboxypeptidase [Roseimaritima multifibrata]QDS92432.1 Zinc carboxypeptidase [Roseimaritima multifibrata]
MFVKKNYQSVLIAAAIWVCQLSSTVVAAELNVSDFSFDGEYGSAGASLEKLGSNHFLIRLKSVPEFPAWTNMVQFVIKSNAKGNPLQIDLEVPPSGKGLNEKGVRGFVSWSANQEHWNPIPRTLIERDGKKYVSLVFPEFTHDKIYVGGEVPLSYDRCVALLKEFQLDPNAELHEIGKSVEGRAIYRLTVTDPAGPVPAEKRWAHHFVNQHCYEYNAQWRMIGMIRYLLSEAGAECRQQHVWHFVVQMNVDGPASGLGRVNLQGRDMNRSYSAKGSGVENQAYESFAVQRDLERLMTSETPITTTWSMHTWDGPVVETMVRPGSEMGSKVGEWKELRDIIGELDTKGQFKKLYSLGDKGLTPKAWCSGTYVQFGVTAFCCEGGGHIMRLEQTLHTGEVLAKALHQFYGKTTP